MTITKDTDFVQALGRIPSGLFIVTAAHQNERAAYLASFVQQASFSPLIFSIACHPGRYPYHIIRDSKKFGLSVIPEGDKILMKTFAKGHGPEEDLIATVDFQDVNGVPLLKDSLGGAVFEVVNEIKPGDHAIFYGTAIAGALFSADAKPWVHVRKSALSY